jgi:hypothetical protein
MELPDQIMTAPSGAQLVQPFPATTAADALIVCVAGPAILMACQRSRETPRIVRNRMPADAVRTRGDGRRASSPKSDPCDKTDLFRYIEF